MVIYIAYDMYDNPQSERLPRKIFWQLFIVFMTTYLYIICNVLCILSTQPLPLYTATPPPPENLQLIPIDILSYKIRWTRPSSAADCVFISYLVTVINRDTGIANPEVSHTSLPPSLPSMTLHYIYNRE